MFRLRKSSILGVTAALVLAGSSFGDCVRFDQIDHCAIGQAELQLAKDGQFLAVGNLGKAGQDGVRSQFKGATSWRAEMTVAGGHLGDVTTFNSISNGFLTSSARLTLEPHGLVARASFTGAAGASGYTLEVLRNGRVVASYPGQTSASSVVLGPDDPWLPPIGPYPFPIPFPIPFPDPSPWPWPWPPEPTFVVRPTGNCVWGFSFGPDVTVTAGRSAVIGDEIRMIEDVSGPGHYPYTAFDAIETLTNGDLLVITGEQISR